MKYFGKDNNFKFNKSKLINLTNKSREDDDDDESGSKQLGYFTQTSQATCLTIPIDEPIKEAQYYRQCVQAICNTGEGDQIEFEIASPGGSLTGLVALLTAMEKTLATTVAHINGDCHSAASMLALSCDSIYVSPYASMLVHFVSYGSAGKATDVKSHVNHVHNTSEKLFRDIYEIFLSEEEIEKCIGGYELWLDSEAIALRLTKKYEFLQAQEDSEEDSEPEIEVVDDGGWTKEEIEACAFKSEDKPKKTSRKAKVVLSDESK